MGVRKIFSGGPIVDISMEVKSIFSGVAKGGEISF